MNIEEIKDKSIALVLWNNEKEDDVHVFLGKLEMEDGKFNFINQEKVWKVSLNDEQLGRLKAVPEELSTVLLNADYALNMSIGSLSDSEMATVRTGMKWHD
jgi:hypothetical protein